MDHWEFFKKNESLIKSMCSKFSCGDSWIADDLYTEAALRCQRVWGMHSPNEKRALAVLRWYLWKKRNLIVKRSVQEGELCVDIPYTLPDIPEVTDEVLYIIRDLDEYDKALLWWHAEGFTFKEIGGALGVSASTARNHYVNALELARGKTQH